MPYFNNFATNYNNPYYCNLENNLQDSLRGIESEIASARKYYNGCVRMFNTKIEVFPSNIVARHYRFETKVLFEIENVAERVAPKVQF